jgi:hypothetical protein
MWLTFFSRSGFKPSIGHHDLPTTSNCHIQAIQAIQAGYVTIKQWVHVTKMLVLRRPLAQHLTGPMFREILVMNVHFFV